MINHATASAILTEATTNGNNGDGVHLPERLPFKTIVRAHARRLWGAFTVTKTEQGKYTISQPLALCVLTLMFSIGAAGWWRSSDKISDQHDEIIRLTTRLEVVNEKNADQDSKIDQARATAQIADKNVSRLEGKFDQFSQVYTVSNPKKKEQE